MIIKRTFFVSLISLGLLAPIVHAFPSGALEAISTEGKATGVASDAGYPGQEVTVDFWLGPAGTFAKYLGGTTTIGGKFSFSIPLEHLSKEICAYAINRAAPNHPNIGCIVWKDARPLGSVSAAEGSAFTISGMGYDPNSPARSMQVDFWIPGSNTEFGAYVGQTQTNSAKQFNFSFSQQHAGKQVCAWGINDLGKDHAKLGCYRHADLRYFGYFQDSTPFRYGRGNYIPEVAGHTNLSWIESMDCNGMKHDTGAAHFCSAGTPYVESYQTNAGGMAQLDLSDLVYRVYSAQQYRQSIALQLQQFIFRARYDATSANRKVVLDADYKNILRAISRHLGNRGLLNNLAMIYPLDEPYSTADHVYNAELASSLNALNSFIKSEGLFAGAPIGVIFAYDILGKLCKEGASCVSNARLLANFDWVGYDGYLSTGETTQDYAAMIAKLRPLMAPNQRLMLVPETHLHPQVGYPSYMCDRGKYPSLALNECVVVSNFDRLYKAAKENNAIAIVPFQWQTHSDGVVHRPGAQSFSSTALGRLKQVGVGISNGNLIP